MPEYIELDLDGAELRVELADVGAPEGWTPVAAGSDGGRVARMASDVLKATLRPLGPVLQHVHEAATAVPNPPAELDVEFGVQLGQDLKLGIVSGQGEAALKVTARWRTDSTQGS